MRKLVIAIDADGTIFKKADFPFVGEPFPYAVKVIKRLKEKGHKIVIWSGRNNSKINTPIERFLGMIFLKTALDIYGIPYDEIDEGDAGKYVADIYIDDRAIEFRGDWLEILKKVEEKEKQVLQKEEADLDKL